jgi:hypothetical protein
MQDSEPVQLKPKMERMGKMERKGKDAQIAGDLVIPSRNATQKGED